jgi:predicted NUDIX family NTP pyrophosphohydrolase
MFGLPEGAGGTETGLVSDHQTGSPTSVTSTVRLTEWTVWSRCDGPELARQRRGRYGTGTVPSGAFVCAARDPALLHPTMPRIAAGLLLYRRGPDGLEVLVAHPGGPAWAGRDAGAWSIPKGVADPGEIDLLEVARREFREETGHVPPAGEPLDLGEVRLKSGKVVQAWALPGDLDPARATSNLVEMEWPRKSGSWLTVPEVDRVAWFDAAEARRRLNPAQAVFVDRLEAALDGT